MVRNIFVVGLEPFNRRLLERVRGARDYRFHNLLDVRAVAGLGPFDIPGMLDEAHDTLDRFDGTVDAVVGYWDFPTQMLLAVLRADRGLRGPSLEAVMRAEHKYWARIEQRRIDPEVVPAFAPFDPFDANAARSPPLPYPFWLKPVKAHSSFLGFRVHNSSELAFAVDEMRRKIHLFADPLAIFLRRAELAPAIANAPAHLCIAEAIVSQGRQYTLEGYVHDGRAEVYGVVGSVRGANRSSFERYEYPADVSAAAAADMSEIAKRVAERTGLDETPFNIEFFHDAAHDRFWLLEMNVRISKSHGPLFERVTGVPHFEVMLDMALGRPPDYPPASGEYRFAAKFMPRLYGRHDHAVVARVPSRAELDELETRFPGTDIQVELQEGQRLGDMRQRDSYSYELATIFMAADSRSALHEHFRRCRDALDIRIDGLDR
jgi:biotin carboxylase